MMMFILTMLLALLIHPAFRLVGWLIRNAIDEVKNGDRKDLDEMLLVIGCGLLVSGALMAPSFLGMQIWIK